MEDYLVRLANHANMTNTEPPEQSLVWNLWQADISHRFPDIKRLCEDVLQRLEYANYAANGPLPSESIGASEDISRRLATCICTIVQSCYEYEIMWEQKAVFTNMERHLVKQCAWMIMQGWIYVLAGDIDSITHQIISSGKVREII